MSESKIQFPIEDLKRLVDFDPVTGRLIWKTRQLEDCKSPKRCAHWNEQFAGKKIHERHNAYGYTSIKIMGKQILTHRAIWALATNDWPKDVLDHVNGMRDDNRLANLRAATQSQNLCNRGAQSNSISGFKGVSPHQGKWCARVARLGKTIRKTGFDSPEEASAAYYSMAKHLHGEFARAE